MLTEADKKSVKAMWAKLAPHGADYTADTLHRMMSCYPQTKIYFANYNTSKGSQDLKTHGSRVFTALNESVNHLDNLQGCLDKLSNRHAYDLRVDPANFPFFNECFHVVIATHHPHEYTCGTHASMDKFLCAVATCLTSKYR
uniref:Hemoglobin subunit alpha-A-like n=1 Tax=Geotrypetes seraphini TaxID=260995 RepID=A0A6P8N616_GEOSA|nr:hemoglobin subunit alpha-A-like [Geotrypetes seraphini]